MSWRKLETGAPEIAAAARELFAQGTVVLIGTLRKDGSPRISCVEPCIFEGELLLGMMWRSRKALDLLRDPRIVVRNTIWGSTGNEREVNLRGRAIEVTDDNARRRYREAVSETIPWEEPNYHLFSVDIETASLVEYGDGQQTVKLWPAGTTLTRPYG